MRPPSSSPFFNVPQRASHRTLQWALAISLSVHAALLTLRFAAPETFKRVFEDAPMEVILVNARSQEKPDKAQALAQTSMAGGGQTSQTLIATSPLPPALQSEDGHDISDLQQKIEALKVQQFKMLTQLRQELSSLSQDTNGEADKSLNKQAREERRQQLSRQLAQIEKTVQDINGAPRKRYISPATKEVAYALYYDKLRRAIETKGTQNFPSVGSQKLYGTLTMILTVDSQGRIVETEIAQSSGNPLLDNRALAIARSSAPFDAFTAKMRSSADQIVVVSRFRFTRDEILQTNIQIPEKQTP
jgi:protein TonB